MPYSDTLHHDYLQAFGNEDVREVLLRLPELYRAPLVLRYMDGFATKEIACLLEVPLGTVLARLHRGRKRFERELWAYAQETGLPLPDESVDVVISNGVLNLSARKSRALAEIYRVLRPGGRICMADLTVEGELPPEVANDQSAWAG